MLKISSYIEGGTQTVKLEGEIAGAWVSELDRYWCSLVSGAPAECLEIDLSAVTYIDSSGEALLTAIWRRGAKFKARGLLNRFIVEEITRSREQH